MIRAVALGGLLGAMIACGASKRSAQSPAAGASGEPPTLVVSGDPHAQIEALEHDITAKGGTFVPQATMTGAATPMAELPASTDASCHPAPTPTCGDSCKLADSICVDAKKICDIAVTLVGDAWAAGKCESGKQSCSDAHASCCSCR